MGELIPIICIHDVEPSILSDILTAAYGYEIESPPSLVLLSNATNPDFGSYTSDSATRPPVDPSFKSPFIGWDVEKICKFLEENKVEDTEAIDYRTFLVADEQTSVDKSLLLVDVWLEDEEAGEPRQVFKVRIDAEFANIKAVSVSLAVTDANELGDLVDEDGIYRGGPTRHKPQKLGGEEPRKQLAPRE